MPLCCTQYHQLAVQIFQSTNNYFRIILIALNKFLYTCVKVLEIWFIRFNLLSQFTSLL